MAHFHYILAIINALGNALVKRAFSKCAMTTMAVQTAQASAVSLSIVWVEQLANSSSLREY
jgi:hypothetical protein